MIIDLFFQNVGTLQYMAPEVIDQGQRGYGAPVGYITYSIPLCIHENGNFRLIFGLLGAPWSKWQLENRLLWKYSG